MIIVFVKDGDITRVCSRYSSMLLTDEQSSQIDFHFSGDVAADVCMILSYEQIPDYQEYFDGLFAEHADTFDCGSAAGKHWARVQTAETIDEGNISASTLQDMLILVERFVPLEVIESWDDDMRVKASVWAGLLHLKASDNPVIVPSEPEFLAPFRNVCRRPIPPTPPAS